MVTSNFRLINILAELSISDPHKLQDHRDWECQAEKNVTQMVTCSRCGGGGHLASDCQVDLADTDNFIPGNMTSYSSLAQQLWIFYDKL